MIQDPRGQDLLRRTLDPCALDDTAHHREALVTPAARSGPAENYERTFAATNLACSES
jgi:hypothetical protein